MNKQTPTDAPFLTMTAQQAENNKKPRPLATVFTELQRVDDEIKFNSLNKTIIAFTIRDKVDVATMCETLTSYGYRTEEVAPQLLIIQW